MKMLVHIMKWTNLIVWPRLLLVHWALDDVASLLFILLYIALPVFLSEAVNVLFDQDSYWSFCFLYVAACRSWTCAHWKARRIDSILQDSSVQLSFCINRESYSFLADILFFTTFYHLFLPWQDFTYWDDWVRLKEVHRDRQFICPEVCRTYNFGEHVCWLFYITAKQWPIPHFCTQ